MLTLAVEAAVRMLGYDAPTMKQKDAVTAFVRGKDVFVSLPTGSSKLLCCACLPRMFNALRSGGEISESQSPSIVVVVSPLMSLMSDQSEPPLQNVYSLHFNIDLLGLLSSSGDVCNLVSLSSSSAETS